MAKLIIDQQEVDLPDNSPIAEVCVQAGIPFNCNNGVCCSCQIKILEGADQLNDLTEEEQSLGFKDNNRLACQCVIKTGVVRITY